MRSFIYIVSTWYTEKWIFIIFIRSGWSTLIQLSDLPADRKRSLHWLWHGVRRCHLVPARGRARAPAPYSPNTPSYGASRHPRTFQVGSLYFSVADPFTCPWPFSYHVFSLQSNNVIWRWSRKIEIYYDIENKTLSSVSDGWVVKIKVPDKRTPKRWFFGEGGGGLLNNPDLNL